MMLGANRGMSSRERRFAAPGRGAALGRGFAAPPGPTADATPADDHDDLNTARGIVNGVIFAVPLWAMLGALVWLLVAR